MNEKRKFELLYRLWSDFNQMEFYLEALALILILAFAWWAATRLRARDKARNVAARGALSAFGAGGLERIAFPLLALALVLLLRRGLLELQWERLSLLYLAAPLLAAWGLARVMVYVLRCVFSRGGFLTSFERVITSVVWVCIVLDMSDLFDLLVDTMQQIHFVVGKQKLDLWMVTHASVTVCLTLLFALWVGSLIESRLMAAEQLDGNLREVLARVTKALLSVIALLLSLSLVGIDVTALSVFSGALAVGLGFGLQKIASNYVSGFIILLDRSIRLGDLVAIDEHVSGTVTQITTRYTVLRTLAGAEIIIPNEYLVGNIVRNLSFSDKRVRVATRIQVAYDSDLELAMSLMRQAASRHPRVLTEPPPGVLLSDFGESGITLELGFWVADPEAGTGGVLSDVNLAIWEAFRAQRIEIPFPQREVRLVGAGA